MTDDNQTNDQNELLIHAINTLTEKMSKVLLKEFLKLPKEVQINLALIKSAQLLLANILCQVSETQEELMQLIENQNEEIKELTMNCAFTAFANKFQVKKH
ncbi:MAG: hypothetical protein ACD_60C00099G0005 [uncultured bacterium]|nr:MAG: hypothetical protein ACD_60C00099G0005 [uncultured bacterium]